MSEKEIVLARVQRIPKKTQQDTKYCVGLWEAWEAWSDYRWKTTEASIPAITDLSPTDLQYSMTKFLLEVRKKNGAEYPPNSLHHICSGLMHHLKWNGQPLIDIFSDSVFADFRGTLDAEMKRIQSKRLGSKENNPKF